MRRLPADFAKLQRIATAVVGLLFLAVPSSDSQPVAAQSPQSFASSAIRIVSQRERIPENHLWVSNTATTRYALTNATAFSYKIVDTRPHGNVYGISLDLSGRRVDVEQLAAAERAAYRTRYGKLHPTLAERLETALPAERIAVIIWVNQPSEPSLGRPDPKAPLTPQQREAVSQQASAQLASRVDRVAAPVADRLRRLGHAVEKLVYSPTLHAELHPAVIRQVATWDEIDTLYLDGRIGGEHLHSARPTVRGDVVGSRGVTGSGVEVANIGEESRYDASDT